MPRSLSKKERENKQESQIVILLIFAYLISYYVHSQIIPYLHLMFFPFLFCVEIFNYIKSGKKLYLFDFPIFIHLIILIYLLFFKQNQYLFSLCWILSIGYCSPLVFLWKNIVYLDLNHFFSFYINYSPSLIIYIISNDDKINFNLLWSPYLGLLFASIYYMIWSIINIFLIKILKPETLKIEQIPFMKMSKVCTKIFCASQLKYFNDNKPIDFNIYFLYTIIGLFYLWTFAGISMFLYQYKWICFFYIIASFIFCSVQGFRLFLANLQREIDTKNAKKKS